MLLSSEPIGALVRRLRDERGYTQGQVVEYTNARLARTGDPLRVTREWLSFVETGRIERPERERLEAIAHTLNVPAATLWIAAGHRAEAVAVPEPDTLEMLRQVLARVERDLARARDEAVLVGDPELEGMLKEVGRDLTEEEREGIKGYLRFARERKRRTQAPLPQK